MKNYLLLTPGPLTTTETVRKTMMLDWCTWDKDYNEGIVSRIREELLEITGLEKNEYTTVLLQGSGTYCVEATLGATVKDNDQLLIVSNGAYGERMADIANYYKLNYKLVSLPETEQVNGSVIEKAIQEYPDITHMAVVHCETTTGILNNIEEIAKVISGKNITYIVDAMSSFGGIPIDIEKLGIDFLVSSANKCIQGVPGFGFVIARINKLKECKGVARSLSLDIYDQWETMEKGKGKWRFTSPTHVVRAFYQALQELKDEGGIAMRYERFRKNQQIIAEGMHAVGFTALLPVTLQSPVITSFLYPSVNFSFNVFYERLKTKGFVIYPGKISGADTFRIGNIGDVHPTNMHDLIVAIQEIS